MNAATMYQTLRELRDGDPVPDSVYILDYRDGTVPSWTVVARRELGADGVQLILADGPVVHVMVLTFPAKTLRSPIYHLDIPGTLCDLMQQHRKFYDKRAI